MKYKAVSSLVFATLLYGMYGVYSRWIGLDFGIFAQNFARNLIVTLLVLVFLLFSKKWAPIKTKDIKWLVLWITSGLVSVITVFVAFNHIPIGVALLLFYAGSIISGYLVGSIFFQEKLNQVKIIAIVFSLIGVSLIYLSDISLNQRLLYLTLALVSGFASGSWNALSKTVSDKYPNSQLVFVDAAFHTFVSLIIFLIIGEKFPIPEISLSWLGITAWAATQVAVVSLVIYGFKQLEAHLASLIMPLEVFFGAFFGFLFFKEILTLYALLGGVLILIAFSLPHLKIKQLSIKT